MQLTKASDDLAITGQITANDIANLAGAGFKSVICNRPDHEEPGQPTFDEIAAAAVEHGLEIRHQPVRDIAASDAAEFGAIYAELPKPVLAYCRSGARCTNLATLSGTI